MWWMPTLPAWFDALWNITFTYGFGFLVVLMAANRDRIWPDR